MPLYGYLSSKRAAAFIGVSVQTLAGWRKRGAGPPYAAVPSTVGRNDAGKRQAVIVYPIDELGKFVDRYLVLKTRLPRPFPGRMPGGKNRQPLAQLASWERRCQMTGRDGEKPVCFPLRPKEKR